MKKGRKGKNDTEKTTKKGVRFSTHPFLNVAKLSVYFSHR